ncbi:hypothetical protein A5788_04595 [Gordonia sp. 852002-50816_SCH5313054-c]|uniref:helix-turn-helix domain-containing protein n=1 Tax=unclassified Gordonia (in: high G+C Gram-positive bacteria) TaxID=2657482 RepID=UPI0007EABAE7|nr:hypothetical protein A5786_10800 [Gordonia sp. 852002-50816_SCH5313054-a]OBC21201.1 hypothetical protein A5788_04595 [Gordonia sp. 852002-50816_SCH5313054-c]
MSREHEVMTTGEVAAYLRVPVATLYRWRSTGSGPPAYSVGRHLRFRRVDVDAWLISQPDRSS